MNRAFLDRPADLDRTVVPQKPPNLTRDFGHRIGRKLVAERHIETAHGLDEADTRQLIQIVWLGAAPVIPPHDRPD